MTGGRSLLSPPVDDKLRADWTPGKNEISRIVCTVDADHTRPGKRTGPLDITLRHPDPKPPVVWTWEGDLLFSAETVRALTPYRLTGFSLLPAVVRSDGVSVPDLEFYEVKITGWSGFAPKGSGVRRLFHCEACGLAVYSCFSSAAALIEDFAWDGSDFSFVWPAPRFVFVTNRVVQALSELALVGWRSIDPSSVQCLSQLTPGRFEDWLSSERIAQLREQGRLSESPYGIYAE
jgi:hypothetical protein